MGENAEAEEYQNNSSADPAFNYLLTWSPNDKGHPQRVDNPCNTRIVGFGDNIVLRRVTDEL